MTLEHKLREAIAGPFRPFVLSVSDVVEVLVWKEREARLRKLLEHPCKAVRRATRAAFEGEGGR